MKRKCNAIQLKYCYDCGTVTTMSLPICSWIETSTHKRTDKPKQSSGRSVHTFVKFHLTKILMETSAGESQGPIRALLCLTPSDERTLGGEGAQSGFEASRGPPVP